MTLPEQAKRPTSILDDETGDAHRFKRERVSAHMAAEHSW